MEVLTELRRAGLEPKRLRLIQHDAAHPPSAVLAEGVKGAKTGLEILPARLLHRGGE